MQRAVHLGVAVVIILAVGASGRPAVASVPAVSVTRAATLARQPLLSWLHGHE
jgi:hypothetical protein